MKQSIIEKNNEGKYFNNLEKQALISQNENEIMEEYKKKLPEILERKLDELAETLASVDGNELSIVEINEAVRARNSISPRTNKI